MSINRYVVGEGKLKAPPRHEKQKGRGWSPCSFFMLTYYRVLLDTRGLFSEHFAGQQLFSASPESWQARSLWFSKGTAPVAWPP